MFHPLTWDPLTVQGAGKNGGGGDEHTPTTFPLTEPLEITGTRETVRTRVTAGSYPLMVLRIGWAPVNADPLPAGR